MSFYTYLVNLYNQFLAIFPPPIQWLVTLAVLVGLAVGFFNLIRTNWLFLLLLIVLLPVVVPILQHLVSDLYNFFLYLLHVFQATAPR